MNESVMNLFMSWFGKQMLKRRIFIFLMNIVHVILMAPLCITLFHCILSPSSSLMKFKIVWCQVEYSVWFAHAYWVFFSNQAKYLINDHFLGVTIDSLLVITKKDSLQVHLAMSFRSITTEIPQPVGKSRITKRFSRRSDQSIVNKLVYKFHTW